MKDFKAKHPYSYYKSPDHYYEAVWRNNKDYITEALDYGQRGSPKQHFIKMVKEYVEDDGLSPTKAMKAVARSTVFTSEVERIKTNAFGGLKSYQMEYKDFRELTKVRGRYTKIDPERLKWKYDESTREYAARRGRGTRREGHYEYTTEDGRTIIISFSNSPYGVSVREAS